MPQTIEDFEKMLEDAKGTGNKQLEVMCIGALGNLYAARGDVSQALEYQKRRLEFGEDATGCHNIAATYWKLLRDYPNAIYYMQRAVDLSPNDRVRASNERYLQNIVDDEEADRR